MVAEMISIAGDISAIAATSLAFYIFVAKRAELRAFLRAVTNFALQDSLGELRTKLDELDQTDAAADPDAVIVKFHKLCGQLAGNPVLEGRFREQVLDIRKATRSKKPMTEHRKAELVHRARESLKYIHAEISGSEHSRD